MCDTMCISSATTNTTNVILIPNREVKTLTNTGNYKLIIACNVEATSNLPVYIQTALGNIPVLCRYSNTLYANQLQKRTMYRIGYGNANDNYDLGQFTIQGNVCPKASTTTATTETTDTTDVNPSVDTRKK